VVTVRWPRRKGNYGVYGTGSKRAVVGAMGAIMGHPEKPIHLKRGDKCLERIKTLRQKPPVYKANRQMKYGSYDLILARLAE